MPVCLWKGCEFGCEELTAFQEHLITKHAIQQPQQLNLDNQKDKEEDQEHGEPMTKKAKMDEKEDNKMMNRGGQRKIIFLAVEVWVDVLGFIRRIRLAETVSLANRHLHQLCWPRLHGGKVIQHRVWQISIGYRHALGQPPTARLLKDHREVPFPESAPPGYITGFERIEINFLDHQVLAFLSLIAPCIRTTKVLQIHFGMQMGNLDANQLDSMNQLLQLFRDKMATLSSIHFDGNLSSIQFLADVDNKMKTLDCWGIVESDIPILMDLLASPRPDGQQRLMEFYFGIEKMAVARKFLDAIKEKFRASIQPLPQAFFIKITGSNLNNIPQYEEEQNVQTNETLAIVRSHRILTGCLVICRHPRGQHEQWEEDAMKRLNELQIDYFTTRIFVNIAEFGMPFCSP